MPFPPIRGNRTTRDVHEHISLVEHSPAWHGGLTVLGIFPEEAVARRIRKQIRDIYGDSTCRGWTFGIIRLLNGEAGLAGIYRPDRIVAGRWEEHRGVYLRQQAHQRQQRKGKK